jgi:SAM-dependent methyltransferase
MVRVKRTVHTSGEEIVMSRESKRMGSFIKGMRHAYARGDNVMMFARSIAGESINETQATLIAYDMQSGRYIERVKKDPEFNDAWCQQIADQIKKYIPSSGGRVLEVGCGEANTLVGVAKCINRNDVDAVGYDLSWSRIHCAQKWLKQNDVIADVFVGDLFHMPLRDDCVDVVYSSHSLEPNGGRESEAIAECLRVGSTVVLVEPIYELAGKAAQKRMDEHCYVRGLKKAAESLGAEVLEYRLLECCANPYNPSGVIVLRRNARKSDRCDLNVWMCPMTDSTLMKYDDFWYAEEVGIAYPILKDVSMLRPEHAIVATGLLC